MVDAPHLARARAILTRAGNQQAGIRQSGIRP
jgi:citrate lyase beta subunit